MLHFFFGVLGRIFCKRSKSVDQPKVDIMPRKYRVCARIVEISQTEANQNCFIGPRRVLLAPRTVRFEPASVVSVRLEFIRVYRGCVNPKSTDGLENLLESNPNIIESGWFSIATTYIPDLVEGQLYNGIALIQDGQRQLRTFVPSTRSVSRIAEPDVGKVFVCEPGRFRVLAGG